MNKKKKLIIKCISLIAFFAIYKILEYILKLNNLAFRNAVVYIFISIFIILLFSILIQIIIILYNTAKKSTIKLSLRIISGMGTALIPIIMVIFLIYGYVAFAFTYEPEHIVEKNGKQMVAYVDSFLDVNVNYYDYVNKFVRGNQLKIHESYGSGGYDPFERDEMPPVKHYTYYGHN